MKPFVKWAGGKTQLLDNILNMIPSNFGHYYEPFVGGGAVFLNLKNKNTTINDKNVQLYSTYVNIRDNVDELIKTITKLDSIECDKDYYYSIREKYNQKIISACNDVEMSAFFIWLNKHAFNGLYRVNSKGLFNVPYNNGKNNSIDENNLREISLYLGDVVIKNEDFYDVCSNAKSGDFIYFDPPYIPQSQTAYFTDYNSDGFGYEDNVRLLNLSKELTQKGCYVMLSNNDVELIYDLYKDFFIHKIPAKRMINSNANNRNGSEVIITNYEVL